MGEWISVDDELPKCSKKSGDFGVPVLIYPPYSGNVHQIFYGCRVKDRPDFYVYGVTVSGVKFWRNLPDPPK